MKPAAVARRGRLEDKFLIPNTFLGWVPGACLMALRAVSREDVQVVYSTAPTPTAHLVGWFLKKVLGLRWVIEFRDPWLRNPFRRPRPFAWMERLEKRMERSVIRAADHIVVTSREYGHEFLEDYPELPPAKITFIPNGFDPEDFFGIEPKRFDRWTIVHAGNFYSARSARPFLEALDAFLRHRPSLRGKVQVRLVGNDDAETRGLIDDLALGDVVAQTGSVPHRESIAYMLGADVLLLIPGPGRGTMPGKTFEYLAARKPILALAEEGVVLELVAETGAGVGVNSGDLFQIAEALERLFDAREQPFSATAALARYDRRNIAEAVARVLDDVVVQTASSPNQVVRTA